MGGQYLYPRLPLLFRLPINFSASGDNTIVPADAVGNRVIVHRLWFVAGGATNITFIDRLTNPAPVPMIANMALVFDTGGEPWFITDQNTSFKINSSAAVQVSGECFYTLAF